MFRKVSQNAAVPELLLAEAPRAPGTHLGVRLPGSASWPPPIALNVAALDTASWKTRAARGLSWHRSGNLPHRRIAH